MRPRSEEEPDPDEDPGEESPAGVATALHLPSVPPDGREFVYCTDLLSTAEVADGTTLAERLTAASAEGWDLVDVIAAGDTHAVLLRRVKQPARESRQVGFAPPSR